MAVVEKVDGKDTEVAEKIKKRVIFLQDLRTQIGSDFLKVLAELDENDKPIIIHESGLFGTVTVETDATGRKVRRYCVEKTDHTDAVVIKQTEGRRNTHIY